MNKKEIKAMWYPKLSQHDAWKEFMKFNCERILESKENCERILEFYKTRVDIAAQVNDLNEDFWGADRDVYDMYEFCKYVQENYKWEETNNG